MTPIFVDISAYQGIIDFAAYRKWAASFDGKARIAIKATEGTGFIDPNFAANRARALAAGIDEIYYYHFARPDLNNPVDEANFMMRVVGAIRNSDMIILDYEVQSPLATAAWALAWLVEFGPKYGKLPGIYASSAYIQQRLQWPGLDAFPLWLANWQFTPDERPACPPPWQSYEFVQYSDKASIPGIPGTVDANIFLGGTIPMATTIPQGWTDDGTILTAPNGHHVIQGFREKVLSMNWDPANVPLEEVQAANPVEDYYGQATNEGTRQLFLFEEWAWTSARGVYRVGVGNELRGARADRDRYKAQAIALQAQIATLTQPAQLLKQLNGLIAQASTANAQIDAVLTQAAKLSQVQ